jgi:Tol biopolymer transport system component
MYFIQLSREYRGRVVAAVIAVAVGAALSGCSDQPTAPGLNGPSTASAALGSGPGPVPICWPNCAPVSRILYVKGDTITKTGHIWAMNPDGTGQVQVTSGAGDDDDPAWSPDYKSVVFASNRRGAWEIFTVNADGTGLLTPLTNASNGSRDDQPTWSPDGTKIYFERAAVVNNAWVSNIYSVSPFGGAISKVTHYRGSNFYDPSVSPDGTKILVTGLATNAASWADAHLFTVTINGGGLTQITNDVKGEAMGNWSPDGTKIVFVSNGGMPDFRDIATVNADGSGRKTILARAGGQEHPTWARDGSAIAFVDFGGVNKWGWLFSVKPDGTNLTQLEQTYDLGAYYSPSWSR